MTQLFELPPAGPCWEWQGRVSPQGYGMFWDGRTNRTVHGKVYELMVGPVPKGYELDHLCRNRKCCNPQHLEAVTHAENMRRGMAPAMVAHRTNICKRGHELTPENTYTAKTGWRRCLTCVRDKRRTEEFRAKRRTPEYNAHRRLMRARA